MNRLRGRVVAASYLAGWKVVGVLPARLARALFDGGADVAWRRGGAGVDQLRRNLARVVDAGDAGASAVVRAAEADRLVRAGLRSYARFWLETFRLPHMATADVLARVHTEGEAHLDAAATAGKGIVLALPHSGNWDVAGLWLVQRGLRLTTVAERLRPESLFDRFVAYRESLGMEVLALHGSQRPVLEVLSERLRSGGCVCLVAERDLSLAGEDRTDEGAGSPATGARRQPAAEDRSDEGADSPATGARLRPAGEDRSDEGVRTGARRQPAGLVVDFFGEPASMPPGPALLAATTGAALLPVTVYYTDDGWGQWIGAPIELGSGRLRERLQRATQALADSFAERIALHPADWHMLQPIWAADVAATAGSAATSAGER